MTKVTFPSFKFSNRFNMALEYALFWHGNQPRKSTSIPYICHPLGVAASIIEAGGDEDQAIGGLLHDVAEDCGGEPRLTEILETYGPRVESIVRGCSDSLVEREQDKAPWPERKLLHLKHLESASDDVLIVTAADKLNNARAIATDFEIIGSEVWSRFHASAEEIAWYYISIYAILVKREVSPVLLKPLAREIKVFSQESI